jgi:hypothetical protein
VIRKSGCASLALLFCCTLAILTASGAYGDSLVLIQGVGGYVGFEDTSLFSENENSGGGSDGVFAGTNGQLDTRRALIRADFSVIPQGSTITDVSLQMTVMMSGDNFGNVDFTLHKVFRDWGEGDVIGLSEGGFGAMAAPGDATWLSNAHGASSWTDAGGDFAPNVSATAAAGLAGTTATWGGPNLVADVQGWIEDPSSNHGWLILSTIEGEFKRVKKFYSSEALQDRPVLTIQFTPNTVGMPLMDGIAILISAITIGSIAIVRMRRAHAINR